MQWHSRLGEAVCVLWELVEERRAERREERGQVLALLRPKDSCCSHHTKPKISPLLLGDVVLLGLPLVPGAGRKVCWPHPCHSILPRRRASAQTGKPLDNRFYFLMQ